MLHNLRLGILNLCLVLRHLKKAAAASPPIPVALLAWSLALSLLCYLLSEPCCSIDTVGRSKAWLRCMGPILQQVVASRQAERALSAAEGGLNRSVLSVSLVKRVQQAQMPRQGERKISQASYQLLPEERVPQYMTSDSTQANCLCASITKRVVPV